MVSDVQSPGQNGAAPGTLDSLLREYMRAAEEELLERADHAGSSAEQNLLFELLGELRHRGEGIIETFFHHWENGERDPAAGGPAVPTSDQDLRLVRDAVVERLEKRGVAGESFPVGLICDLFLASMQEHGIDVDGCINLLDIFERAVLEQVQPASLERDGNGAALWDRDRLAAALEDHLLRNQGRFDAWHSACGRPELSSAGGIGQRTLVSLLASLRGLAVSAATSNLPAELLMNSLHQKCVESGPGACLHPVDAQVIFLVLCRLQRLYSDPDLDSAARAQLGRLCIPLVAGALVDPDLLLEPSHPGRQLVNELSGTMLGWKGLGDLRSAATWRKVDAIIGELEAHDPAEVSRFADCVVEWRVFRRRRKERLERLGFGVRTALEDLQRTDDARLQAMESVREHLLDREVPDQVMELAAGAWGDVLFHYCLENGLGSVEWNHAIEVLDSLLASVQRDIARAERPAILAGLPALLRELRVGLREIGMEVAEIDHLLSALQQVHGCLLFSSGSADAITWVCVDEETFSRVRGRDITGDSIAWQDDDAGGNVTVVPDAWLEFSPPLNGTTRFRVYGVEEALHLAILVNGANLVIREISLAELGEGLLAGRIRMLDRTPVLERALAAA